MIKHIILSAAIAAGGLTLASIPLGSAEAHSLGRSATPHCKTGVIGRTGVAVKKDKAKKRARRKWAYDAKRKYGYAYSGWQFAQPDKHYHCEKKAGTWRCRAVAHPCNWQAQG